MLPPKGNNIHPTMARTRSIRIRESLEELEQLRRFYKGTPQERRVLFLFFLKESSGRTVAEASVKAGIAERRGRRWWDAYRKGGLSQLLELRIWKKEEMEEPLSDPHFSGTAPAKNSTHLHNSGIDFPAFLVAVSSLAGISESTKWARSIGDIFVSLIPEVDYAVVSIKSNVKLDKPQKELLFHQHLLPNQQIVHEVTSFKEQKYKNFYDTLIDQGKRRGFPFEQYHAPSGFDFYVKPTQEISDTNAMIHVGSILLLRRLNEAPFSPEVLDLIERLRPFIAFLFTDFIVRAKYEKPGADLFNEAITQVAGDVGLSPRERDVLILEMLGHSYDEIAELLHVSPKTIQTHVRALYQKAGVSRLSEFFARYFTPRTSFGEKRTK